jgi:hypothetical protein
MESYIPIESNTSTQNFVIYFVRKSGIFNLRSLANQGSLGKLGIRTQSWRIFLNIFPETSSHDQWLELLMESRRNYEALKSSTQISDPLIGVTKI